MTQQSGTLQHFGDVVDRHCLMLSSGQESNNPRLLVPVFDLLDRQGQSAKAKTPLFDDVQRFVFHLLPDAQGTAFWISSRPPDPHAFYLDLSYHSQQIRSNNQWHNVIDIYIYIYIYIKIIKCKTGICAAGFDTWCSLGASTGVRAGCRRLSIDSWIPCSTAQCMSPRVNPLKFRRNCLNCLHCLRCFDISFALRGLWCCKVM